MAATPHLSFAEVAVFGGTPGLAMGMYTSLMGLSPDHEPLAWLGVGLAWVYLLSLLAVQGRLPSFAAQMMAALHCSVLSGLMCGCTQGFLAPQYRLANPWYETELSMVMDRHDASFIRTTTPFVVQGLAAGTGFGVTVGALLGVVVSVINRCSKSKEHAT